MRSLILSGSKYAGHQNAPRDNTRDAPFSVEPGLNYGPSFWFTYAANTSLMVAVSLLFRYGDFIQVLGGTELELGWIVGAGTIGSLAMRLVQGVGIDRCGPRRIWLVSLAVVFTTLLAHLAIQRADGPAIYLNRIAYHTGLAGAFGASITYIGRRAPVVRLAELVGMLGSSGFVGMVLGTQLGDLLCGHDVIERGHLDRMFQVAAGLSACSLACAWLATRGEVRPATRKRLPMFWLIRRYQPGRVLLMGVMTGIGLGLPGTFVRPYAGSLGIATIGTFFGVYAVTAFMLRMASVRLPERIGTSHTILFGMTILVASQLLFLLVHSAWQLAIPGIATGAAHALLFPSIVASGSGPFPVRYRGLGTTLILGTFDLGNLIGMPFAGSIVHAAQAAGWEPYATMFLSMAAIIATASFYYWLGVRSLASASG